MKASNSKPELSWGAVRVGDWVRYDAFNYQGEPLGIRECKIQHAESPFFDLVGENSYGILFGKDILLEHRPATRTYGDGECIATDVEPVDPADHEALRVALEDMAKATVEVTTERDELRVELDKERKRHAATIAHFEDRLRRIVAEAATP